MSAIKLVALVVGFVGAMIVIQPTRSLVLGVILELGAGVNFAYYIVSARRASTSTSPVKRLVFQCLLGTL